MKKKQFIIMIICCLIFGIYYATKGDKVKTKSETESPFEGITEESDDEWLATL